MSHPHDLEEPTYLDENHVADCRVFEVHRRRVRMKGGELEVFTMTMPDWATVVAVTKDERIVLVRQHRYGVASVMLETPGGIVDEGEAAEAAGARELVEETGFTGSPAVSMGWVHPNPAIQNNRIHLLLIRDVEQTRERHLDPHESTAVEVMTIDRVKVALRAGDIRHALSALALERALAHHL